MLDIFVVTILVALVHLGALANISPGETGATENVVCFCRQLLYFFSRFLRNLGRADVLRFAFGVFALVII